MNARKRGARLLAGIGAVVLGAPLLGACANTPAELQRMRVENELLREQLRIVRSNCSYYRDVEMEVDETPAPVAP